MGVKVGWSVGMEVGVDVGVKVGAEVGVGTDCPEGWKVTFCGGWILSRMVNRQLSTRQASLAWTGGTKYKPNGQ